MIVGRSEARRGGKRRSENLEDSYVTWRKVWRGGWEPSFTPCRVIVTGSEGRSIPLLTIVRAQRV